MDCIDSAIQYNNGNFESSLSLALNALRIAWHDIVDILHDELKIYLDELNKNYGPDIVASVLEVPKLKNHLRQIEDLIAESRGNRDRRIELYQKITKEYFEQTLALYRECRDLEPAIASTWKKERNTIFWRNLGVFLAVASLMLLSYTQIIGPRIHNAANSQQESEIPGLPNS